ncbi:MAG: ferritin-like domain-containing protein [Solirubrobacterales bacterium]|nr:ferritin-like domain-containing protein [Solirubrobacterales bacterium]
MSTQKLAAPELESVDFEPMDRGSFVLKGAIAAAAVYGVSAVGPLVRGAFAQGSSGDIDILNYALTLEFLESAFYEMALKETKLSSEVKGIAETIAKDEAEHVTALEGTIKDLGGKAVKAPGVDFGEAFADEKTFLTTAITFEDLGVSAYNGAAPMIKSVDVLAAAGSIVQVEARHAAVVRFSNGESPSPMAFDEALDMDAVLKAAKPFITS